MKVINYMVPKEFYCEVDSYIPLSIKTEGDYRSESRYNIRLSDEDNFVEMAVGRDTRVLRDFTIVNIDKVQLGMVYIDDVLKSIAGIPVFDVASYRQEKFAFKAVLDYDKFCLSLLNVEPSIYYQWENVLFGVSQDNIFCQVIAIDLTQKQVDDLKWKFKL